MGNQQTALTKRSIDTPSGRISYTEAGSGPVALFVHGVVLNKHVWRHQLTGLSDIASVHCRGFAGTWRHRDRPRIKTFPSPPTPIC